LVVLLLASYFSPKLLNMSLLKIQKVKTVE
jgi:hypothetical protein